MNQITLTQKEIDRIEKLANEPIIEYKAPKGCSSLGTNLVSDLLNKAELCGNITFTDDQGQFWELKKL